MDETASEDIQTLDVHPLKKTRRTLLFLADYFIVFILGVIFFHALVYPSACAIIDSSGQYSRYQENMKARDKVLYGNELLFYEGGVSDQTPESFDRNLAYTCERFLSVYVNAGEAKYEVFRHYYGDIDTLDVTYVALYEKYDAATSFWTFEGGVPKLKPVYVEEFSPLYREGDTMSEQGQKDYERFQNRFFLTCYSAMLQRINKVDLTFEGISYRDQQSAVNAYIRNMDVLILTTTLISFSLGVTIVYFAVPMIHKHGKTISMMFLREERLRYATLTLDKKRGVPLLLLFGLASSFSTTLFIPWGVVGFNELFSLPMLFPLALISLALVLASLIVLISSPFNRTIGDYASGTVLVDEATLDDIYRAKGYDY